jgi:hypothetical protein
MSTHESIEWFAVDEQLPDDDVAVLVCSSIADVWLGLHEHGGWISVDGRLLEHVHALGTCARRTAMKTWREGAIRLDRDVSGWVRVYVERRRDGERAGWVEVIADPGDVISHIVERAGIDQALADPARYIEQAQQDDLPF